MVRVDAFDVPGPAQRLQPADMEADEGLRVLALPLETIANAFEMSARLVDATVLRDDGDIAIGKMLKELGVRNEAIETIRRALAGHGLADERGVAQYACHGETGKEPIVGRVLAKGLAGDEMSERVYLVVDGVDGRVHHMEFADPTRIEGVGHVHIFQTRSPMGLGCIDHSVSRRLAKKVRALQELLDDEDLNKIALDEENAEEPIDYDVEVQDLIDLVEELEGHMDFDENEGI
jgi:hypothetical protein